VSLPDDAVYPMLRDEFVVGWRNNWRETYTGHSRGYNSRQCAVGTTNGAGARNMQIYVLDADGTVIHALPGFWHPEDLARELEFAKVMHRLYRDEDRTPEQKERMAVRLHLAEIRRQPVEMFARSGWQDFDQRVELARAQHAGRDTVIPADGDAPRMKPVNVLVHERMAARPFVPFDEFDIPAFIDYGTSHYDNNRRYDTGRKMPHR